MTKREKELEQQIVKLKYNIQVLKNARTYNLRAFGYIVKTGKQLGNMKFRFHEGAQRWVESWDSEQ